MKLLAYLLGALLIFGGLVMVLGMQGQWARLVVGIVLWVAAGVLLTLVRRPPGEVKTTIVQKVDLSGDVKLEELTCRACGGGLSKDSVHVRAGGIFVECPYCGAAYQLDEAPKW